MPEQKAMQLTGHLTRAVFDRYDICNEQDLREGAAKLNSLLGTMTGTKRRVGKVRQIGKA